MMLMSKRCINI